MHPVRVKTFDTIHPAGLALFGPNTVVGPEVENPDVILVRSHQLVIPEIPDSVLAVGRAGAGTNTIPVEALTLLGIPVFNTPGGNANAVAELVANAWGSVYRHIRPAQRFVHDLDPNDPDYRQKADAGKSQFAGNEVRGKTIGIIGLGAIGSIVAQLALDAGMHVIGYDPYLSVLAALRVPTGIEYVTVVSALLRRSDLISLHLPLTANTHGMIGEAEFAQMKPGVVLLNYAREELVETGPLLEVLDTGDLRHYATDFPMPEIHRRPNVSATPHLGASTAESEETCATRVVGELLEYLEHGGIRNSVNFPAVALERHTSHRLVVLHANEPMMSASITGMIGAAGVNISANVDTTMEGAACSILDLEVEGSVTLLEALRDLEGVYRVRYIQPQ